MHSELSLYAVASGLVVIDKCGRIERPSRSD